MGRKEEQTEMVEALEMTTVQQTQSIYWSGKRRKRGMGTKDMEHVSSTCQEDFSTALSVTFFSSLPSLEPITKRVDCLARAAERRCATSSDRADDGATCLPSSCSAEGVTARRGLGQVFRKSLRTLFLWRAQSCISTHSVFLTSLCLQFNLLFYCLNAKPDPAQRHAVAVYQTS